MVQLRVEDSGQYVWIDLYETEPIKLTLSIEDITNANARSVFSRTFRVPNTGNNNKFFKHAFEIEGIDYDVTVKKAATILVDGAEFRTGHIRLQKIYKNRMDNKIDYEIVFLGETRDFASVLGDKTLGDCDLSQYNHDLSYTNVTNSWQAYPQGAAPDPVTGVGDGLFNGDILYPLVDFGEIEGQERFRYTLNTAGGGFNHQQNAVDASRFKPMIRAKALWDCIFAEAGFTYTSQIANSGQFTQLYVSAFGNEPGLPTNTGSANELDVALSGDYQLSGTEIIEWDVENIDPSNNYNPLNGKYTVPATGNFHIDVRVQGATFGEVGGGGTYVRLRKGPLVADILDSDFNTIPAGSGNTNWVSALTYTGSLNSGDQIYIEVEEAGDVCCTTVFANSSYFRIPTAAGQVGISTLLDNEYKQIDFVKDMLTKFRLVMAYDKNDPKNFIVEPWIDYIGTGDLYDWTDKVDHSKDMSIEPLFFTQSDRLEFSDAEDGDWLNQSNILRFKETFGTLKINSGNELLKGTREITTGFAPTPITQIEGGANSNFLIPSIHAHETEDNLTKHTPIKAVTRLLFYNGLKTQAGTFIGTDEEWYFDDDQSSPVAQPQTQFPMVSYWEDFDSVTGPGDDTINLNWQIETGYANPYGSFDYEKGVSMFTRFWSDYVTSLYSKYARRVSCTVSLDYQDLVNFSFDDVIFIDGVYYYPEKLTDVVVGEKSLVRVDLIKLINYDPRSI